ncbi:MAG: hypothetical protein LBQ23_03760 [Puniceicoccales bacterium]|nr:hypothetical protein [Puniceicoccales bacterium]
MSIQYLHPFGRNVISIKIPLKSISQLPACDIFGPETIKIYAMDRLLIFLL